jgi:hypothetical protein
MDCAVSHLDAGTGSRPRQYPGDGEELADQKRKATSDLTRSHCLWFTMHIDSKRMENRFVSFRNATASAVFDGDGETPSELRRAVASGEAPSNLAPLAEKIRSRAFTVTDADIDALRGQYSEDQLFELIVAATLGAASERLAAALRAMEEA